MLGDVEPKHAKYKSSKNRDLCFRILFNCAIEINSDLNVGHRYACNEYTIDALAFKQQPDLFAQNGALVIGSCTGFSDMYDIQEIQKIPSLLLSFGKSILGLQFVFERRTSSFTFCLLSMEP